MTADSRCGPRCTSADRSRWSMPPLADHAEAVVREAISNVVRARRAHGQRLGHRRRRPHHQGDRRRRGHRRDVTRSGLANLAARAEECAGSSASPRPPAAAHACAGRRRCPRGSGGDHHGGMPLEAARHCRSTSIGTNSRIRAESKPRWASATASLITSSGTSGNACTRAVDHPVDVALFFGMVHAGHHRMWTVHCARAGGSVRGAHPGQRADAGPTGLQPGREHRHEPVQRLLDVAAQCPATSIPVGPNNAGPPRWTSRVTTEAPGGVLRPHLAQQFDLDPPTPTPLSVIASGGLKWTIVHRIRFGMPMTSRMDLTTVPLSRVSAA